jgi:hypothetical protein
MHTSRTTVTAGSRDQAAARPAPDHTADDGGSPEKVTPGHGPRAGRPTPSADPDARPCVILPANEFSLPKVLRHLEAGRTVLFVPATSAPALAADPDSPNPGIKAKPKKDRS